MYVLLCDRGMSTVRRPSPDLGNRATKNKEKDTDLDTAVIIDL